MAGALSVAVALPEAGLLVLLTARPVFDQMRRVPGLGEVLGQPLSVLFGAGLLLVCVLVFLTRADSLGQRRWLHSWWPFAAFIFSVAALSQQPLTSLGIAARVVAWVLVVSVVDLLSRPVVFLLWLPRSAALGVFVTLTTALVVSGFGLASSGVYYEVGELWGGYYSPQGLAFPLAVAIPVVLRLAYDSRAWAVVGLMAFSLASVGVFASFVRTAWLAWLVMIILSLPSLRRSASAVGRRTIVVAIAAGVLLAVVFGAVRWQDVEVRSADVRAAFAGDLLAVGSGRGQIYDTLWRAYLAGTPTAQVVGLGMGASQEVTEEALGFQRVSHSDPLWVLVETGLVGAALALFAIVALLTRLRRALGHGGSAGSWARTALITTGGLLVLAVFNGVIADGPTMYLYALVLGASYLARDTSS
jgi:hypothetical protein